MRFTTRADGNNGERPRTDRKKLEATLGCPACKQALEWAPEKVTCRGCGLEYPIVGSRPVLLGADHALRSRYLLPPGERPRPPGKKRLRQFLGKTPEDRTWSRRSVEAIEQALTEVRADDPERVAVNLGAAIEGVFRDAFRRHPGVLRIGLPHLGSVDAVGDLLDLPVRDEAVDLFLSCSVLEHVSDPERGVQEMARVVRPAGLVYAEIPFIRAFHMAPVDYQRYTISGIEELFARHGFVCIEKGVCSGPFTAWSLMVRDAVIGIASAGSPRLRIAVRFAISWLVQPLKHLDRLVGDGAWARTQACNFYFLGRRQEETPGNRR